MNDQTKVKLTTEAVAVSGLPQWMPERQEPEVQDLLEKIALQNRRIAALERIISSTTEEPGSADTVRLKAKLPRQPKLSEAPVRQTFRAPPWWPQRADPSYALAPSPGAQCLNLKMATAKVLAFAVFGLDGAELEREVARVAREQLQQGNFIPVFLTDAKDHEVFRRRRYMFEYFPHGSEALDLDSIQPRLEAIEAKWGVDLFINIGLPRGAWVRRNTRVPAERYMLAKQHFLAGRYAQARRMLQGFTEALNEKAPYRHFGRQIAKPRASVIVVSHADNPGVAKGLASIAAQITRNDIEVILVDNGNGALLDHGKGLFKSFGFAEPGFNSGPGAARNLGAHHARAPYLIFLDDDGVAGEGCLDALVSCIKETGAVGVRGKVKPLTAPELTAIHYDLGPVRIPALTTTEGIAIWNREAYLTAGGYDPLLYGHEGVELCARMWRFYGPAGFIYEPKAVLYHDFASDPNAGEEKKKRYQAYGEYIDTLGTRYREINSMQNRFVGDQMLGYLAMRKPEPVPGAPRQTLSVITTAKNAKHFVAEYTRSLKSQTDGDFEVIFVDDHSLDGTGEEIRKLWEGDNRLKVFSTAGMGRGAALNTAMRNAKGELCMVADVDDLSVPERVALTRNFFAGQPNMECMSFVAFNEKNPFRLGPPRSIFVDDVAVRQLFGMPVSFPTFSFKRKRFTHAFNEELPGGIDCDWLFRRIEKEQLKGRIVFYPAVYYREHEGQITASRKGTQLEIRKKVVTDAYARVLGELSEHDLAMILLLGDTKQATNSQKVTLTRWAAGFLQANRTVRVFEPALLDEAMFEALRDVKVIPGA